MTNETPHGISNSNDVRDDKHQVLVLLSGGLDSSACLKFYLDLGFNVSAIFIDYGHAAAQAERAAADSISSHYGVRLACIQCLGLPSFVEGFIQGRNAFLLFCALMTLGNSEEGLVAIGIHSGTRYTDCTSEFLELMQKAFDLYAQGTVRVAAPFILWDKEQIWLYCLDRNVPINKTYSCERGLSDPCGHCVSCKDMERLRCS